MIRSLLPAGPKGKIESFCLSVDANFAYAGTLGGDLAVVSTKTLTVESVLAGHAGLIAAVARHSCKPWLATLSADNTVGVWSIDDPAKPILRGRIPLWEIQPRNDDRLIEDFQSESQALAFHSRLMRLATRSANGALLEVDFDSNGKFRYVDCIRVFRSDDLTCVRYLENSDILLAGSIDGELSVSLNGSIIQVINIDGSNIHWIEPLVDGQYLLASDSRMVVRINAYTAETLVVGPRFARDDLEHVAVTNDGQRAFAASFDRTIYEIDPVTCEAIRTVFNAPFKCRWVRPLDNRGEAILVQTRDGGLHRVDTKTAEDTKTIRSTPQCIWTAVNDGNSQLVLSGDSGKIFYLNIGTGSLKSSAYDYSCPEFIYAKRIIKDTLSNSIILGRIDGKLFKIFKKTGIEQIDLGAPVRDITGNDCGIVWAALEDGRILKISLSPFKIVKETHSSNTPIWSIAENGDGCLAAAERSGSLCLFDSDKLTVMDRFGQMARPKRMKWIDQNTLAFVRSDEIYLYKFGDNDPQLLISSVGNTIEDFIINEEYGYILSISYMRNIYLHRVPSGRLLCMCPDGIDYSKGLAWIPDDSEGPPPLSFITYGRHGAINLYNIINEKIIFERCLSLH